MEEQLAELKERLREVSDLKGAAAVLHWDQSTYMPPAGAAVRGRQMATLGRLAHERFTDPGVGRLLDALEGPAGSLPHDSDEASLVRVVRRRYDKARKVPPALLSELEEHAAATYQVWSRARPENDFAAVRPFLEKTLDLSRRIADCFPGYDHVADPLIDMADEGMTTAQLRVLFDDLRRELVPLAAAAAERPAPDDACLHRHFPEERQLAFGRIVIEAFGFDFGRGRQDKTLHPFMTRFGPGDIRITTRAKEHDLSEALFSTLHEAGHALYEMGVDPALEGTPLGRGASSGVHESQSRLWENRVGRSRGFWTHWYPRLREAFPKALGDVDAETFYRAVNRVERSLVRTEADEVTYNLHVMIRFDLELALLEGSLAVADLPEAWHARYRSDLGLQAPDDTDGVLQDVHWYAGTIGGAFQGYTLGNVMSAAFYDKAVEAHPGIPSEIEAGRFDTLRGWLGKHLYRHGAKFTAGELVERITAGPISIAPYVRYLRDKFGEIYGLDRGGPAGARD